MSTDYDSSDRLYFDELSYETVMDICELEKPYGVIVSVGGQIPNNLALPLMQSGIRLLGTSADDIDRAEDRNKFSQIVDKLGIDQPRWRELTTMDDIDKFVDEVGFPVLVRPSYVLSGAAMNVCYSKEDMKVFLDMAVEVSEEHPVVISSFMQRCKELECDAVADNGKVIASAISEHIEFAGVHSGDATIQFPPQKIYGITAAKIRKTTAAIAAELHITGPFNIQFLATDNYIKVIECNLRASRSFPFVSKVLKVNFIDLATRCMLGEHPEPMRVDPFELEYVGIKCSQFSFSRLSQADPVLGVDMASTGEVGCIGDNLDEALLKAMARCGQPWAVSGPAQEAGLAALGEHKYVARLRAVIQAERSWLTSQLADLGLRVLQGSANYLLLYSEKELAAPLRKLGVLIRDCSNYPGLNKGWYRVAVRTRRENRQLIAALRQVCGCENG